MNQKFFEECAEASLTGSKKFPQIVGSLIEAGVESYHVDLIRAENCYYLAQNQSYQIPNGVPLTPVAETFYSEAVAHAVKESQTGQITYVQFMEKIAHAGCSYYVAYLRGKKVIYLGRHGESHTELFPGSR